MKKTIILTISLLTSILILTSMNTENNIDDRTHFSMSISSNPEKIDYSAEISSNFSFSPLEKFCTEKNMKMYYADDIGCIDNDGNIYHYDVSFKDDFWIIGNETYKAVWN